MESSCLLASLVSLGIIIPSLQTSCTSLNDPAAFGYTVFAHALHPPGVVFSSLPAGLGNFVFSTEYKSHIPRKASNSAPSPVYIKFLCYIISNCVPSLIVLVLLYNHDSNTDTWYLLSLGEQGLVCFCSPVSPSP